MKVVQFINSNTGNAVKNHFCIYGGKTEIFQSYGSKICEMNFADNVLSIYPDWDYSDTTRKHFYNYILQTFGQIVRKKEVEAIINKGQISFAGSGDVVKVIAK